MKIKVTRSIYTRGYRIPNSLINSITGDKELTNELLPKVLNSRYITRNRVTISRLGKLDLTLGDTNNSITATLYGLLHRSGHCVILIDLQSDEKLSPTELEKIQNHRRLPIPACNIFHLRANLDISIIDLFNIAYCRVLNSLSKKKNRNLEEEVNIVRQYNSTEELLISQKYSTNGFFIPTIFGATTMLEVDTIPTDKHLEKEPYMTTLRGSSFREEKIRTDDNTLLFIRRNSGLLYTKNLDKDGLIYALQIAMLNFVRHYNHFLCGELNYIAAQTEKKNKKSGSLLDKVKEIYQETVYTYDELHNINLWNNSIQERIGTEIRKSTSWKLEEEVETNLKKMEHLTILTNEVSKVQGRKSRLFVSSLLSGVGFINLMQLIPVWHDYVAKALDLWVPIITAGVVIVIPIAYIMHRDN